MDCTSTLTIGSETYTLHFDFLALRRLVEVYGLPLMPIHDRLKAFDVVAEAAVLLEGLEGGRRANPAARPKPWTMAEAEALVSARGPIEIMPDLLDAVFRSVNRAKKDGGAEEPAEGKAPAG